MPQSIRLWEIGAGNLPVEIPTDQIEREKTLEAWLENDISMLDSSLMVIGRQVSTDFGRVIDLLCIDGSGHIVVVELKKGRTSRDVTAQALEYAAWVQNLPYSRIKRIADDYLAGRSQGLTLDVAFQETFGTRLTELMDADPSTLDDHVLEHHILIVAETMDASTEQIVSYLSDRKISINAVTVQHFTSDDGRELIAQVFLLEPEMAAAKKQSVSPRSRPPYVTATKMAEIAEEKGVDNLYRALSGGASRMLRTSSFGRDSRGFQVVHDGRTLAVLVIGLAESSQQEGMMFRLNGTRLMNHFGLSGDQLANILPDNKLSLEPTEWVGSTPDEETNWVGYRGYFRTTEEVDRFLAGLREGNAPR